MSWIQGQERIGGCGDLRISEGMGGEGFASGTRDNGFHGGDKGKEINGQRVFGAALLHPTPTSLVQQEVGSSPQYIRTEARLLRTPYLFHVS